MMEKCDNACYHARREFHGGKFVYVETCDPIGQKFCSLINGYRREHQVQDVPKKTQDKFWIQAGLPPSTRP